MRRALIIILLIMSGAAAGPLRAQHYLFSHLNRENSGLSYDGVREIFQDSRGYMWIGTYKGLNRYDGTRFKVYDRNDFGVTSDFINVICEDASGNLWIGTDNGVVVYDYGFDRFLSLDSFLGGAAKVPDDRIFAIVRNSKGLIWISSKDTGLYSYNPASGEFRHHPMSDDCRDIYTNMQNSMVPLNFFSEPSISTRFCSNAFCGLGVSLAINASSMAFGTTLTPF